MNLQYKHAGLYLLFCLSIFGEEPRLIYYNGPKLMIRSACIEERLQLLLLKIELIF